MPHPVCPYAREIAPTTGEHGSGAQFGGRALEGSVEFGLSDEFDGAGLVVGLDTVDGAECTDFPLDGRSQPPQDIPLT